MDELTRLALAGAAEIGLRSAASSAGQGEVWRALAAYRGDASARTWLPGEASG